MSRKNTGTIVRHPNLAEIELGLANGISAKLLAEKFNLGQHALYRYRKRMTPERLTLLRYRRGDSPIDLERLKKGEAESTVQRNVVMMSELWQLTPAPPRRAPPRSGGAFLCGQLGHHGAAPGAGCAGAEFWIVARTLQTPLPSCDTQSGSF